MRVKISQIDDTVYVLHCPPYLKKKKKKLLGNCKEFRVAGI